MHYNSIFASITQNNYGDNKQENVSLWALFFIMIFN